MERGRTIFLFFIFISPQAFLYPQPLQFTKEKIELTVYENSFSISADYYFQNETNAYIERTIYYPFIINDYTFYPDSVIVLDQFKKVINYNKSKDGICFHLNIPEKNTIQFYVFYRQKVFQNKAEYILTTTKQWKKPLQKAEFFIRIPKDYIKTNLSLEPAEEKSDTLYSIFYIKKENFMPENNLIVEWAGREK